MPTLGLARFVAAIDTQLIDRFINSLAWIARQIAIVDAWFDRVIVDGIVNVAGSVTWKAGLELKRIQTGNLRQYVMFIVVGTVAIFVLATLLFRTSFAG